MLDDGYSMLDSGYSKEKNWVSDNGAPLTTCGNLRYASRIPPEAGKLHYAQKILALRMNTV
jgi:hypothetical protein